jgi:hypothetical protein
MVAAQASLAGFIAQKRELKNIIARKEVGPAGCAI